METAERDATDTTSETPAPPTDPSCEITAPAPLTDPTGERAEPVSPNDVSSEGVGPAVTYQSVAEWHGKELVDCNGATIGKLERVYFDVETDEPQFGTIKEGFIGRHLTFVPLTGATVGPNDIQVTVSKQQVRDAPSIDQDGDALSSADESALYHHFELNYTPTDTTTGQRLARR